MKMKLLKLMTFASFVTIIQSCTSGNTQIAENTFVHQNKIYKIIDNELREIGDLSANDIKKFEVSKPKQRDLGTSSLSFVKPGASTKLTALYRGNYLYYNLVLTGINDLRENYSSGGQLTIQFVDEYGFILHSTVIPITELVSMLGEGNKTDYFVYNGKTEMSTEINSAIVKYDVTASLKAKGVYGF